MTEDGTRKRPSFFVCIFEEKPDMRPLPDNPRTISPEQLAMLKESMEKYGDLSGIVVNRTTGHIVGGNQRTKHIDLATSTVTAAQEYDEPTDQGTVLEGHIEWQGEKFNYREVEWDEPTERRAAIYANKLGGQWDYDSLSTSWKDVDLPAAGFAEWEVSRSRPQTTAEKDTLTSRNTNPQTDRLEAYQKGTHKSIELLYPDDIYRTFDDIIRDYATELDISRDEAALQILESHARAQG